MTVYPNVKINLGLNVIGKRPDGFHDIETLFIPYFGIRDELSVEESDELVFEGSAGVTWDNDLTVQAYELLAGDFDIPPVRIKLVKNAPVGAGLGGGSADAAFALRAVSDLFSLGLSDEALAGYASRLGSDCAFFVYNRPMIGTGRGERLEPCDIDLSGYDIKLVCPEGISVRTADAYRGIVPGIPQIPLKEALSLPVEEWKNCLVNDFEKTVFAIYPSLARIKSDLYEAGAVYAAMSGSGSAMFGLFEK